MDITNISTTIIKTPEAETETPTRIQPPKPIHTNGLLKRHHHPLIQQAVHPPPQQLPVFVYRDCLKNHAAHIGGHALDGCGEFMPAASSNPADPTTIKCAACGCHRNFHRRRGTELNHNRGMVEFHSPNRHQPPPPPQPEPEPESPNSPSPPPISSTYYPTSAPHMLLALSSAPQPVAHHTAPPAAPHSNSRKRFRTKFTQQQKEKMLEFAGKVGWKIQKRDETLISELCNEIGVDRSVLKVWMHNNKSTHGRNKKSNNGTENSSSGSEEKMEDQKIPDDNVGADAANGNGNGSSTST